MITRCTLAHIDNLVKKEGVLVLVSVNEKMHLFTLMWFGSQKTGKKKRNLIIQTTKSRPHCVNVNFSHQKMIF